MGTKSSDSMRTVIVRYGEIALKSEPVRRRFEDQLVSNIKLRISGIPHKLRMTRGRIFIDTPKWKKVATLLSKTPGVVSVSGGVRVDSKLENIQGKAVEVAKTVLGPGKSFAVRTSREGKQPYGSQHVNVTVGAAILSNVKGTKVNLSSPDCKISIEIRGPDAYIFTDVVNGVGGLPVGSQRRAAMVFQGSANDVVAAFLMLKRGCDLVLLFPDLGQKRTEASAMASAKKLLPFRPNIELWTVPFKEVLEQTKSLHEAKFQQAVLHGTGMLASHLHAECLVVGDGADEIASRGLGEVALMDAACGLPVLRPLALMEKTEIKEIALGAGIKLPRAGASQGKEELKNHENERMTDSVPTSVLQRVVDGAKNVKLGGKL